MNKSAAGRSHRWFPHFTAIPMGAGKPPALIGKTSLVADGLCGEGDPRMCLPNTHHLSLDGGRSFARVNITQCSRHGCAPAWPFDGSAAAHGQRPKHGGGLNMFFLLPTGAPGQALILPGSDSGLVNTDGTTGVHTDLQRGSAWSDAGGRLSISPSGAVEYSPVVCEAAPDDEARSQRRDSSRANFTISGLPRNTSAWFPNPYWRVITLPNGRYFGVGNAGVAGQPAGHNKAMLAVTSRDGIAWRYHSTIANESIWSSGPLAEGMGENSCAMTPSGRIVVVWRTNGGHHKAIGPSGPGLMPYNMSISLDSTYLRWSSPRVMRDVEGYTMGAAQPQLLYMPGVGDGVVLLSGGRSGNFLWHSTDGEHWSTFNLAEAHNSLRAHLPVNEAALFTDPWTLRDQPAAYNDTKPPDWPAKGYYNPDLAQSTAYTSISAVDESTISIVYDRIGNGWWGPPGPFGNDDHVFAMRLTVKAPLQLKGDDSAAVVHSSTFQVDFGSPKLVDSSNFTHFWFPITEFELDGTIMQLVRQGPDGGTCPPKGQPDWPCSASYAANSQGKTWQTMGSTFPFPLLPESPTNSKRASGPNISSIELKCTLSSCTGSLTHWSSTPPGPSAGDLTFEKVRSQPLVVSGVPVDLREAADGLLPVMLTDGSILMALYGYTTNATSSCSKDRPSCYSIFFFSCAEPLTSPTEWAFASRIDAVPAMVSAGGSVEGPCEPALAQLPDGRVFVIFRVSSYQEMWGALSSDNGKHWDDSFSTGTWAVSPNMLVMTSGAVVLTAGRPSIVSTAACLWLFQNLTRTCCLQGLWVTSFDSVPPRWEFTNVIKVHNALVIDAAQRYPDLDAAVQNASSPFYSAEVESSTCNAEDSCNAGSSRTCAHCSHNCTTCAYSCVASSPHCSSTTSYTGLASLDDETLLLAYDRLANGFSGPPGNLGAADFVFTMTINITKTIRG